MNEVTERELLRLLHGELPPERARALEARLEREPELARAYQEMRTTWSTLELPPASAVPPGFATRVAARARELEAARRELSWRRAPVWARVASAMALVAGFGLGVELTWIETPVVATTVEVTEWTLTDPGLAELYSEAVESGSWAESAEATP